MFYSANYYLVPLINLEEKNYITITILTCFFSSLSIVFSGLKIKNITTLNKISDSDENSDYV